MNQIEKNQASVNKLFISTIAFITVAATFGNSIGVLKGEKTIQITLVFLLLGIGTIVNVVRLYKKSPTSDKVKYHGSIGFFIMYTFTLLTAERNMVFIYIIPVMYMLTMYYDVKLSTRISIAMGIVNVISLFNFTLILKITDSNSIMNYVIQSIAVFVVCISSVLKCKLTNQINEDNMDQLREVNAKQEGILEEVLSIGGILDKHSKHVFSIVSELKSSSGQMQQAVEAMLDGINKTSDSIMSQTSLSKDIQSSIADTSVQAKDMDTLSQESIQKVEEGVSIIKELTKNTQMINGSGSNVSRAMESLKGKTTEIDRITDTITTIAKQINILSLNAAIESARAGEAGKSFAIVAKEIGTLADQTTKSVSGISDIIEQLQSMVDNMVDSLDEFNRLNEEQNGLIGSTQEVFHQIDGNMKNVNTMVSEVSNRIENIFEANEHVMKNVTILNEETKESKRNIETTEKATNQNLLQVEETQQIAEELLVAAERLQVYM